MSASRPSSLARLITRRGLRTTPLLAQRTVRRIGYARQGLSSDAGFTLVEVLVSFVVFAIVATASVAATINTTKASAATRNRVAATDLAQQDLQTVRATTPRSTVAPLGPSTVYSGGARYTLTRAVPTRCPAVTSATGVNKITVTTTVTWTGTSSLVVMATVISC